MKLCLIGPVPPPYGGVANWEKIVEERINTDSDIDLSIINTSANKRPTDGRSLFNRVYYGAKCIVYAYRTLKKLVKDKKIDIVHMTTSGGLGLIRDSILIHYLKKMRIPVVYHIHFGRAILYKKLDGWNWRMLCKNTKQASHLIVIDKLSYQLLLEENANISYINNPIDLKSLEKYEISSQNKIVYIGWIIKEKGIEELLEAYEILKPNISPDVRLELIGPANSEYISYLHEKYSFEGVEYLGELEHGLAMRELASAEIFILPSYTEGFPNVILEAMALKKPIIATNVGAIPDILADTGIIIHPQDIDAIVSAVSKLMAAAEERKVLGINAFDRVRDNFEIEITYEKYKKLWNDLVRNQTV